MNRRTCLTILGGCLPAGAQQPPAEPSADVVFRSTSLLIEVNVVAVDKRGHSITDLTKEDFIVTDNGVRRDLAVFVAGTPDSTAPPMQPGQFSNISTGKTHLNHTVILLDMLNTQWSDAVQSRRAVVRVLERLGPKDRVALYTLDTSLRIVHQFDSDRESLLKTIASLRNSPGTDPIGTPVNAISDASVGRFDENSGMSAPAVKQMMLMRLDRQVRITIQAFKDISAHLNGMPGRKAMIWLSSAFPVQVDSSVIRNAVLNERSYTRDVNLAIQALNEANVSVYPVDARGLPGAAVPSAIVASMEGFAKGTGGRAFRNSNDLNGAMQTVLDEVSTSYTLGFYAGGEPGKHRIRIQTSRPDSTLRYRETYSIDNPARAAVNGATAELNQALVSPLDTTRLAFAVDARHMGGSLRLNLAIKAGHLQLEPLQGRVSGAVQALIRFADASGTQVGAIGAKKWKLDLKPETYRSGEANVPLTIDRPIPAGATVARIVVQGNRQGVVGSVTFPLARVPAETAERD